MLKKTRCPKNYVLSETEVATIVSCSVSLVKKIRSGVRVSQSASAQTIIAVDELANQQKTLLIQNLKSL